MKDMDLCMENLQLLNIHALLSDSKFHNKLQSFRMLYEAMEQKKLHWAVYSSAAMFLLGITPDFNDWDLITAPEDAEEAFDVFATLKAYKHPEPPPEKARYFDPPCKTYTDTLNTEFDISPEFTVLTYGTGYTYYFNEADLEFVEVDGLKIPICPAEALFVIYYMMTGWQPNRQIKVKWLKDYLATNLRHPNVLEDALAQNIPYWIKQDIKNILGK